MAGASVKIACMLVVCMVVAAPYTEAMPCNQVVTNMLPCLNYLKNGGAVPPPCCKGVMTVNNAAKTTPDRRSACTCLKNAATAYQVNVGYANSLPGKCGVSIPFNISPSTDCSKVY